MTTFEQSDWTATIVAAGTSGTIRKSPDPSSSREGAGPPDYYKPLISQYDVILLQFNCQKLEHGTSACARFPPVGVVDLTSARI